jgi:peroxiredoxin
MKKNNVLTLLVLALSLAAITLITVNTKKLHASAKNTASVAAPTEPGYSIGSTVANFTLKNYDGTEVTLTGNDNVKGYILVFTCNHCPFAKAYHSRVVALHKKYEGLGYPVLAINPNSTGAMEDENEANNMQTAKSQGFSFPYLSDATQEQAKLFGAKKTPTAYILQKENGNFVLKYGGAIDDNAQDEAGVSSKYLETALGEILLGKAVSNPSTKSVGCGIKWKNA